MWKIILQSSILNDPRGPIIERPCQRGVLGWLIQLSVRLLVWAQVTILWVMGLVQHWDLYLSFSPGPSPWACTCTLFLSEMNI